MHNFQTDKEFCLISGGRMSNSLLDAPSKCGVQILSFDQTIENAHKVNFYSVVLYCTQLSLTYREAMSCVFYLLLVVSCGQTLFGKHNPTDAVEIGISDTVY